MNVKVARVTALGWRPVAAIAGAAGLILGAVVLTAGPAVAANGIEPGNLTLTPASGPLTTLPTWSTIDACPTGFQGSADLIEFNTDGTLASVISQVQSPASAPFSNVPTLAGGTVGALLAVTNIAPNGTVEWAVECWSGTGASGASEFVQSTFITEDSTGTSYTSGVLPANTATTTTVTASPNPVVDDGSVVTLTATELAADGTHPAGSIQFSVGTTNIGAPVTVNASGVATTTTIPSAAGTEQISAVFTPSVTGYDPSTGTTSLTVVPCVCGIVAPVPINVTVPATGALTVTVAAGTVSLNPAGSGATLTATAPMNNVTVMDTRNTAPGWSVSGQESIFTNTTSSTVTIPADDLGWAPTAVNPLVGNATLGPVVAPGSNPGLGDVAQVLASATAGNGVGTNTLSASLTLAIPAATPAGAYTGSLTITYLLSH